ncbi:MAG: hypothetical protein Q8M19_20785 [Reyranella sp.]|nr:hypothetical protein [Reyranella sp.]
MSDLVDHEPATDLPIDAGIRRYVLALRAGGVETFESCEGGPGHAMPEPTIRFHGNKGAGFRALAVAMDHGLPILSLRLAWPINDGLPSGPWWEMTFSTKDNS